MPKHTTMWLNSTPISANPHPLEQFNWHQNYNFQQRLTHHVGESQSVLRHDQCDVKRGSDGWLVKAGERTSGASRFKVCEGPVALLSAWRCVFGSVEPSQLIIQDASELQFQEIFAWLQDKFHKGVSCHWVQQLALSTMKWFYKRVKRLVENQVLQRGEWLAECQVLQRGELLAERQVLQRGKWLAECQVLQRGEWMAECQVLQRGEWLAECQVLQRGRCQVLQRGSNCLAECQVLQRGKCLAECQVLQRDEWLAECQVLQRGSNCLAECQVLQRGKCLAECQVLQRGEWLAGCQVLQRG